MSAFAIKMLTILGFVLYSGGPIDALEIAVNGPSSASNVPACADGCLEARHEAAGAPMQAPALRPGIGMGGQGDISTRLSFIDYSHEQAGAERSHQAASGNRNGLQGAQTQ